MLCHYESICNIADILYRKIGDNGDLVAVMELCEKDSEGWETNRTAAVFRHHHLQTAQLGSVLL